eukprot:s1693_g3.t1
MRGIRSSNFQRPSVAASATQRASVISHDFTGGVANSLNWIGAQVLRFNSQCQHWSCFAKEKRGAVIFLTPLFQ